MIVMGAASERPSRPAARHLIVNADDFGRSPGVNSGIIIGHEHGVVTSASLMVRWPAAVNAARYARDNPELSVGLHVDLGEWTCLPDGEWIRLYEVVDEGDSRAVAEEVAGQLEAFRSVVGRNPTHLDSHQHVHREEPVLSILEEMAHKLGVPLRDRSLDVRYLGDFYGQDEAGRPLPELIDVASLVDLIDRLPVGWTELGCHPGLGCDIESMYVREREAELQTLCDARVMEAVDRAGIRLASFHDHQSMVSNERRGSAAGGG